jgi:hypothetical protein
MQRKTSLSTFAVTLTACALALTVVACTDTAPVTAPFAVRATPRPSLQRTDDATELGYFDGAVYRWQFPSGGSDDQNELVLDCFRAGPDMNAHANAPRGRLYALFLPGANQHSCPDGSEVHDHILSGVPGTTFATEWELLDAQPGPNFDPAIMPLTSEAALLWAAKLGQVIITDDEVVLHAVVLGPAS